MTHISLGELIENEQGEAQCLTKMYGKNPKTLKQVMSENEDWVQWVNQSPEPPLKAIQCFGSNKENAPTSLRTSMEAADAWLRRAASRLSVASVASGEASRKSLSSLDMNASQESSRQSLHRHNLRLSGTDDYLADQQQQQQQLPPPPVRCARISGSPASQFDSKRTSAQRIRASLQNGSEVSTPRAFTPSAHSQIDPLRAMGVSVHRGPENESPRSERTQNRFSFVRERSKESVSCGPPIVRRLSLLNVGSISTPRKSMDSSPDQQDRRQLIADSRSMERRPSQRASMTSLRRSFVAFTDKHPIFKPPHREPTTPSRPIISLPTPDVSTAERLKNKIASSRSTLSIAGEFDGIDLKKYHFLKLRELLGLCGQREVIELETLVAEFGKPNEYNVAKDNMRQSTIVKIAEASFSEVYGSALARDNPLKAAAHNELVYKLIPFGSGVDQPNIQGVIQEIEIGRMLQKIDGFVPIARAWVARGKFPAVLRAAWEEYYVTEARRESLNPPPNYDSEQLYCVIAMAHGGLDLEHYTLRNPTEALEIFKQTAELLARAEVEFEFEHRDLHWGNILVQHARGGHIRTSIIDFTLSRGSPLGPRASNGPVFFTRLDHPDFFRGRGDYQFEVYRQMQRYLSEQSPADEPDWAQYQPRTNVFWLHYLAIKLQHKVATFNGDTAGSAHLSRRASLLKTGGRSRDEYESRRHTARALGHLEQALKNKRRRFREPISSAQSVLWWCEKHWGPSVEYEQFGRSRPA